MSIGSIGAGSNYSSVLAASSPAAGFGASVDSASAVMPHRFGPNDPLNQYLTADDRSTIKAATGIDIHPNGSIMVSLETLQSRGGNAIAAAMESIGQIAADRANGKLSGPISADYLNQLIKQFGPRVASS